MATLQHSNPIPAQSTSSLDDNGNASWVSVRDRCATLGRVASEIARDADHLVRLCTSDQRVDPLETIASELIPLCDALAYLRRQGPKILRDRRLPLRSRPLWLWGVRSHVRRAPLGRVLVLGAWNYPLLLPGVQVAQALAGGNTVELKPAVGTEAASAALVDCFHRAGVPRSALRLLDSSTESAIEAIDRGADLIVLTGAASTGRKVLARAAGKLSPAIMELSGCDAVVVLEGTNLDQVCRAIRFGLTFNSGATCIGPRRILIRDGQASSLVEKLVEPWRETAPTFIVHPSAREHAAKTIAGAIRRGAKDTLGLFDAGRLAQSGDMSPVVLDHVPHDDEIASSDLFAPLVSVVRVRDESEAIALVNQCQYRLGASVFGPGAEARRVANQLDVGSLVINDLVAPTADPRLPFGGRGDSGFGVTRGEEGLLAMTTPVSVSERRGIFAPHLARRRDSDAETLLGSLQLIHGQGLAGRMAGLRRIVAAVKTQRR